jgi:hypothetical protein
MMDSSENSDLTEEEREAVSRLVSTSRALYLQELISQQQKLLRRSDPGMKQAELTKKAKSEGEAELRKICKKWFKISHEDYMTWLLNVKATMSDSDPQETEDLSEESDEDE